MSMNREFEFFHGVALARLVHYARKPVTIELYPTPSNASYIVNGTIGIYIKHSSKRLTPWGFSFGHEHQNEILEMRNKLGEVFTLLVCNDDGIVCLSFDELKMVLDEVHGKAEWVGVSRRRREKYQVRGSDGELRFKIGNSDYPEKIFTQHKKTSGWRKLLSWSDK